MRKDDADRRRKKKHGRAMPAMGVVVLRVAGACLAFIYGQFPERR